jgi:hypothetical protein
MLLTDVYYAAGEIEARALRRPSWARTHTPARGVERRGPRRVVGHALIGLGRLIAAESAPAGNAQLGLSR